MHQALSANRAGTMLDQCTVNDLYRPRPVHPYTIPDSSFSGATKNYRKIPKISPGAFIFQRPFLKGLFLEGPIFGGAYVRREICL